MQIITEFSLLLICCATASCKLKLWWITGWYWNFCCCTFFQNYEVLTNQNATNPTIWTMAPHMSVDTDILYLGIFLLWLDFLLSLTACSVECCNAVLMYMDHSFLQQIFAGQCAKFQIPCLTAANCPHINLLWPVNPTIYAVFVTCNCSWQIHSVYQ